MKQLLVYAIGFLLITNLQAQQLKGVIRSLTVHNIPRILRRGMKVNSSDIDIDDTQKNPGSHYL